MERPGSIQPERVLTELCAAIDTMEDEYLTAPYSAEDIVVRFLGTVGRAVQRTGFAWPATRELAT